MRFPRHDSFASGSYSLNLGIRRSQLPKRMEFFDIVLLGDSGGNQPGQKLVAEALNKEWASTRVHIPPRRGLYNANGSDDWLRQLGETTESIGTHASIPDTSQLLALYPEGVRRDKLAPGRTNDGSGVSGDPTRATVAYGKKGLELKIATAVRVIQAAGGEPEELRDSITHIVP